MQENSAADDLEDSGGGDGESQTTRALAPLLHSGWSLGHPIRRAHGDLDHVAVGPGGTYLLASRELRGSVELRGGVPWLERRHHPPASTSLPSIRPRALSAAARLEKELYEHCTANVAVRAVVVLWAEFPATVLEDGRCVFLAGTALAQWLSARPKLLGAEQLAEIRRGLELLASRQTSGAWSTATS
ncbi:MAG TPA: NERD domain-containing protein [Solirubrobacteraceae bacterium]